jgi:hypothetical protein
MLRADTDEHGPEEAVRLRRHVHGEILGDARDDDTPLPLPLAPEPTRTGMTDLDIPRLDPPRPPPASGSRPPPASGSRPPPASGSRPPPASGSRPPPASGSRPPLGASRQASLPGLAAPPLVDDAATVPVPLLDANGQSQEATPPPLPPSPASAAAEVWLEDAVTRPSMIADLAGSSSGQTARPLAAIPVVPAFAAFSPDAAAARSARTLLVLSSATSFVVGLVLGALLFRGRSEAPPPREPAAAAAAAVCGPGETPDGPSVSR